MFTERGSDACRIYGVFATRGGCANRDTAAAPSTQALLQTSLEEGPRRTRAVSYCAAVADVASTVGLVVGGILAARLPWRDGCFINLAIGAAMMLAAPRFLPETAPRRGQADLDEAVASPLWLGRARWCSASCASPALAGPTR